MSARDRRPSRQSRVRRRTEQLATAKTTLPTTGAAFASAPRNCLGPCRIHFDDGQVPIDVDAEDLPERLSSVRRTQHRLRRRGCVRVGENAVLRDDHAGSRGANVHRHPRSPARPTSQPWPLPSRVLRVRPFRPSPGPAAIRGPGPQLLLANRSNLRVASLLRSVVAQAPARYDVRVTEPQNARDKEPHSPLQAALDRVGDRWSLLLVVVAARRIAPLQRPPDRPARDSPEHPLGPG